MAIANAMLPAASYGDCFEFVRVLEDDWDSFYTEWQNLDRTMAWNVECYMQEAVVDDVDNRSFETISQEVVPLSQSDSIEGDFIPTFYNFDYLHSPSVNSITSSTPSSSRLGDCWSQSSTLIIAPPISDTSPNEMIRKTLVLQQYSCTYCDQSFDRRHKLNRHEKLHTKPVKCPVEGCTHRVAKTRDLNRHIMAQHTTHILARPLLAVPRYKCPVAECEFSQRGFRRKDNLKRHMRNTHGEASG